MTRRVYLLGLLLLCVNICFCYDHLSNNEVNKKLGSRKYRVDGRKSRRKLNSKHQAQIDVASFIQSPDKSSIDESQSYEQYAQQLGDREGIDFGSYEAFRNANAEIKKDTRQYRNLNANNVPEVNVIHKKHFVPQNMNLNTLSRDEKKTQIIEPRKIGDIKKLVSPYNLNVEHISRTEKKCALKNMKIPFFSRKKNKTTKPKKGKKRKPFGFRKRHKQSTTLSKISVNNINAKVARTTEATPNINKIMKRSYYESLCPACRQRFCSKLKNTNIDVNDSEIQDSNNIIHNSRQYFQKKAQNSKVEENDKRYNFEIKPNILENYIGFERSFKNRRLRRDDANEDKRKKILEDIENKIKSLKLFYQQAEN